MMTYCDEIQDSVIDKKLSLFMTGIVEMIGDNDEAVDSSHRTVEKMQYQNGYEFSAAAWLSYYWSTGTGTPLHDGLIERLMKSQGETWAEHFPDRKSIDDIMTSDDANEPHRNEAEEWEQAALLDEAIFIQVEAVRSDGDIKFTSSFTNEINRPYGNEFEIEIEESAFMAMDGDDLEKLAKQIASAPYEAKLDD